MTRAEELEALELVRAVRHDSGNAEAREGLVRLAIEARAAKSPAYYTYNKLLRLLSGAP